MPCACHDVRRPSPIELSALLALAAAVVSLVHYDSNGSLANASFLNAAHWVLVFLLLGVRFDADKFVKTEVECVYFTYGILFGEVDSDSVLVLALICISMLCYFSHRKARQHASAQDHEDVALAPEATTYSDGTV